MMRVVFGMMMMLSIASFSFAQVNDGRTFSATIIAGANFSQIQGDQIAGFDKPGFNVGARAGIILDTRWELGFEILFSQQGSQSDLIRGFPRAYYCRLDVIEVPLLVFFKDWEITNEKNQIYHRFHAGAGFSYNRLMSGVERRDGFIEYEGTDLYTVSNFKQNYVMFVADVNFYFTRNWGVNLRFEQGVMNIRKQQEFVPRMLALRALFTL